MFSSCSYGMRYSGADASDHNNYDMRYPSYPQFAHAFSYPKNTNRTKYDTNNYDEFKLKIKLCKMIEDYNTSNFGTFLTEICDILSKHHALERFQHSFIRSLLSLDLSQSVIQEINGIDLHPKTTSNEINTNLDTMNDDEFISMVKYLNLKDIAHLQTVNRNLQMLCYNPVCYKYITLNVTSTSRQRFFSHWRFSLARSLSFGQGPLMELHPNWSQSVTNLSFSDSDYLEFFPPIFFRNVSKLCCAGKGWWRFTDILQGHISTGSLRELVYEGPINEQFVCALSEKRNLVRFTMNNNAEYEISIGRTSIQKFDDICDKLETLKLNNIEYVAINRTQNQNINAQLDQELAYLTNKLRSQLIKGSQKKVHFICRYLGNIRQEIHFPPIVATKLKAIQLNAPDWLMNTILMQLASTIGHNQDKMELIDISWRNENEPSNAIICSSLVASKLCKYCKSVDIKLHNVNVDSIFMPLLKELVLHYEAVMEPVLILRCFIDFKLNGELDKVLSMMQQHRKKLMHICNNIVIQTSTNVVNINYGTLAKKYGLYFKQICFKRCRKRGAFGDEMRLEFALNPL